MTGHGLTESRKTSQSTIHDTIIGTFHSSSTRLLAFSAVRIFETILRALEAEPRVMLATIISTTGSTPAAAFSKMLIMQNGTRLAGTVGGGCMEADVLEAARTLHLENRASILTFHLNEREYVQGLICGGSLEVLIEPIDRTMMSLFQRLLQRCNEGEDSVLATVVTTDGTVGLKRLLESDTPTIISGLTDEWKSQPLIHRLPPPSPAELSEQLHRAFHRHETRRVGLEGAELLLEPIAGTPGLIIFGGGHVSSFITRAAALAGFRVTVVDDRPEYARPERFPDAHRIVAADFPDALNRLQITSSSFIVIVTRGHRYDEEILERALHTDARYIGMIGSKRKVLTTFEHLLERGIAMEQLKRVHAPMGLEIGAATAEEIGISVVAELIAVRRGQEGLVMHKSDAMKELLARLHRKTIR